MTDNLGAGRDLDRFFMVVVLSALAIPRDKVLHTLPNTIRIWCDCFEFSSC